VELIIIYQPIKICNFVLLFEHNISRTLVEVVKALVLQELAHVVGFVQPVAHGVHEFGAVELVQTARHDLEELVGDDLEQFAPLGVDPDQVCFGE